MRLLAVLLLLTLISCAYRGVGSTESALLEKYKIHLELAQAHLRASDFKQAYVEALKAKEIRESPEVYNLLGLAFMGLDDVMGAKDWFLKAVSLDDNFSPAWTNLSACYLRLKDYGKALEAAKKALDNPYYLFPERAYYNMAEAYFAMGRNREALDALNKAIRYNVRYAPAYERLMDYYLKKRDFASIKNLLYDAKAAGVESPGVIFFNALMMIREGDVEGAKKMLKGLVKDYPSTSWAKRAYVYLNSLE